MIDRGDLQRRGNAINTLLMGQKLNAWLTGVYPKSRYIRYEIALGPTVRVDTLLALDMTISYALASEHVRVYHDRGLIVVEEPRPDAPPVDFLSVMDTDAAQPYRATLGETLDGRAIGVNLASPDVAHILVAGTTGSGKTVLLSDIILSLAIRHPLGDLGLVVIDPRGMLTWANALPMLAVPVVTDPTQAAGVLARVVAELRSRTGATGTRLVVVVDELADIMAVDRSVDGALRTIVQIGRGAGVHLIAATQTPRSDIVSGVVKANFPVRLIGHVTSPLDANVAAGIKDSQAHHLAGRGDFVAVHAGNFTRFQAAWVEQDQARVIAETVRKEYKGGSIVLADAESEKGSDAQLDAWIEQVRGSAAWREKGSALRVGEICSILFPGKPCGGWHLRQSHRVGDALASS